MNNKNIIYKMNFFTTIFALITLSCGFIVVCSTVTELGENVCPICGMPWDGITTSIVDNETYYYCCPVCALKHVVPKINGEIFGKCNITGENITIYITNGNASQVIPSTTVISLGGTCPTNKLFKNETLAFNFNSSRPALTIQQVIDQKVNPPVEEETNREKKDTPGFELILIILAMAMIIIWKRKNRFGQ